MPSKDDLFLVPFPRNPHFMGRSKDLDRLHETLKHKGPVGITPDGLTGMGGLGKTQLAIEYVYLIRESNHYPGGIFWLNGTQPLRQEFAAIGQKLHQTPALPRDHARQRKQLHQLLNQWFDEQEFRELCFELVIKYDDLPGRRLMNKAHELITRLENQNRLPELESTLKQLRPHLVHTPYFVNDTPTQEDLIHLTVTYLQRHPSSLLIIDHLEDLGHLDQPLIRTITPAAIPCTILFTTRQQDVGRFDSIQLSVPSESTALKLLLNAPHLQSIIAHTETAEYKAAQQICAILGRLPLALTLATTHLQQNPALSLDDYIQKLKECGALPVLNDPLGRVKSEDLPTRHQASIIAALQAQWDSLPQDAAKHLLLVASQLPEASLLPLHRLGLLAGISDEAGSLPLPTAVSHLIEAGLVESLNETTIYLHPLVQAFAASQIDQEDTDPFRQACASRLLTIYEDMAQLEKYCCQWGINTIRQDILVTLDLITNYQAPLTDLYTRLKTCLYLLQQQTANLQNWQPSERPAAFAQQMLYQTWSLGLEPQTREVTHLLASKGHPYWRPHWVIDHSTLLSQQTLLGHAAGIWSLEITPDGQHVVSASDDHTLKVWSLRNGHIEQTLSGHTSPALAVAVTPDGQRAISASVDCTLKVWHLASGQVEQTLSGHTDWVWGVAVTPNGRYAISASVDHTLKVWHLRTGQVEQTLSGHTAGVRAVAVTPDGKRIISASDDHTLKVWNLMSGQVEQTFAGHTAGVRAVAVTPDNQYAISASDDQTLKVWDLATSQVKQTLIGHTGSVLAIVVTPDSRYAISASVDQVIKVWNLATGEAEKTLTGHTGGVWALAITPDSKQVISASDDQSLKVWNLTWGGREQARSGHSSTIQALAMIPGTQQVISGANDHTLKIWHLQTGEAQKTLTDHMAGLRAVTTTPDGQYAISASADHTLKIWPLEAEAVPQTLTGHTDWVLDVAVTPDGRYAVSASADHTLKVWSLAAGEAIQTLTGHTDWVWAVGITPDGQWAVSASADGTVKIWHLAPGNQETPLLHSYDYWTRTITITPDGQYVALTSKEHDLHIWHLATGQLKRTLSGHTSWVQQVVVTADGRYLISVSDDCTLKMWDWHQGIEKASLHLDNALQSVTITPDGQTVVVGDKMGTLYCLYCQQY